MSATTIAVAVTQETVPDDAVPADRPPEADFVIKELPSPLRLHYRVQPVKIQEVFCLFLAPKQP
jgi:hypothetical protein